MEDITIEYTQHFSKWIISNMKQKLFYLPSLFLFYPIFKLLEFLYQKRVRILFVPQNRIGHQVMNNELYLRAKYSQENWPYIDILLIRNIPIANNQILHMFTRKEVVLDARKSIIHRFLVFLLSSLYKKYGYRFPMKSNEYNETSNLPQALQLSIGRINATPP